MSPSTTPAVWLITGCSSGLGREVALAALARGDRVITTARSLAKIEDLKVRGADTIVLDVTSPSDVVQKTIADAVDSYGRVDFLVNNAGYVLVGGIEECSDEEIFAQYNTNVFGMFKVLRAVLPYMRKQNSGVIANIASSLSRMNFPAIGVYGSSKFAVAGLTEALRGEVAPFGIEVTNVDPGNFRTAFSSNGVLAEKTVNGTNPVVEAVKSLLLAAAGKECGDPAKGGQGIVDALTKTGRCAGKGALPFRLSVGTDTKEGIENAFARDQKDLKEWPDLMSGTDCDDVAA